MKKFILGYLGIGLGMSFLNNYNDADKDSDKVSQITKRVNDVFTLPAFLIFNIVEDILDSF